MTREIENNGKTKLKWYVAIILCPYLCVLTSPKLDLIRYILHVDIRQAVQKRKKNGSNPLLMKNKEREETKNKLKIIRSATVRKRIQANEQPRAKKIRNEEPTAHHIHKHHYLQFAFSLNMLVSCCVYLTRHKLPSNLKTLLTIFDNSFDFCYGNFSLCPFFCYN